MSTPTDALLRYRPWRGTLRPPVYGAALAAFEGTLLIAAPHLDGAPVDRVLDLAAAR